MNKAYEDCENAIAKENVKYKSDAYILGAAF